MKILFLNLYSGKVERGAESQAHQLADQLGTKHQVVFLKGNSAAVSDHGFQGNAIQRWVNRKRWFVDEAGLAIFKFTLNKLAFIWKEKPDWVIPMNGFWQVLLLKLIQPFVGFKLMIIGHSGPGWDERWNLYLQPNVFIATTGPVAQWARKTCPWTRVELIPYGIDVSNFEHGRLNIEFENRKLQKAKLDEPIILCPSALVPYKRVDLAIKAVAKMEKGSLIVLGKGPLEDNLRKMGADLLGQNRFLLTSVSYDQMPDVYAVADVVTLPSSPQENSPMVFVESLAAGKPVVATEAPRVRWILEESGYYVDPEDTNSYAEALEHATKSKTNTKKALNKFLWKNVLGSFESLLNNGE